MTGWWGRGIQQNANFGRCGHLQILPRFVRSSIHLDWYIHSLSYHFHFQFLIFHFMSWLLPNMDTDQSHGWQMYIHLVHYFFCNFHFLCNPHFHFLIIITFTFSSTRLARTSIASWSRTRVVWPLSRRSSTTTGGNKWDGDMWWGKQAKTVVDIRGRDRS